MKRKILFAASILIFKFSFSQIPASFYLSHGDMAECKFTSDAIYFLSSTGILDKTDYDGNTIWSKSLGGQVRNLNIIDNSIYFFSIQSLVKIDTSGNFIWARDLSVPICAGGGGLNGLVVSKSKILVSTSGWYNLPSAMFAFDSSGTILNTWCDETGNDNFIQQGYQQLTGGGRFNFVSFGTGTSYSILVRVDSIGNIDTSLNAIDLSTGIMNNLLDIVPLVDSTYLAINNTGDAGWGWYPTSYRIDLSNFREDGTIIWQKRYFSYSAMIDLEEGGTDSLGNIYFLGEKYYDTLNTHFALKLDATGNIVYSEEWIGVPTSFSLPTYSRMGFHQGYMYCPFDETTGHSGVFILDSLLTPPCGLGDSVSILQTSPGVLYSIPWYGYTTTTYTQIDTILNFSSHSISTADNLCLVLQAKENNFEISFQLAPNPASERLTFNCLSANGKSRVEIYNALGISCLRFQASSFPAQIDISKLTPGIYFVKIQNENSSSVQKLMVE